MRNKFFTLALAFLALAFVVNAQDFTSAEIKAAVKSNVQKTWVGKDIQTVKTTKKEDLENHRMSRVVSSLWDNSKGVLFQDGFETFPGIWTLEPGTGDDWAQDAGTDYGPGSVVAGTYAAFFNDYDYSAGVSASMSTVVDLSSAAAPILSFYYWDSGGNDFVVVSVSINGTDFTDVYSTATSVSDWTNLTVDLAAYAGEATVTIKFTGTSVWGTSNPHIDEVVVYEPEAYAFGITVPGGVVVKSGMSYDYVVDITNTGAAADNFTVAYDNNGAWTYELFQADSATVLTDPIAIEPGADTSFVIRVTLPADGLTQGQEDLASFSVTSAEGAKAVEEFDITTSALIPYAVPFDEDFTDYMPENWMEFQGIIANPTEITSTSSAWAADGFANNGSTGAAKLNIYGTTRDEWLATPDIELGSGSYKLTFDMALTPWNGTTAATLGVDDKIAIVISTDRGATWNLDDTLVLYDNTDVFTTNDKVEFDLSAYAGSVITIGFYGESTESNADNDFFIDNLSIYEVFDNDLGVSDIISPSWGWAGNDLTPVVTINNPGALTQDDFTVNVVINNGTSDVYTSSKVVSGAGLASGSMVDITMDDTYATPPGGEYTVTASVVLASDEYAGNDQKVQIYNAVDPTYQNDIVYAFNASDWSTPQNSDGNLMHVNVFTGEMTDVGQTGLSEMYAGDFVGDMGDQSLIGIIDTAVYFIDDDGSSYFFAGVTGMNPGAGTLGMAWDAVTDEVFVSDGDNVLYSVVESGGTLTATTIGTINSTGTVIGLASNSLGELYAVTLDDSLFMINKATAEAANIGYLGININYAQDIGFDRTNDILYGTFYKGSGTGGLYTVNLATGAATQIGVDFQDELTVCAVYGNPQYEVAFNVTDGTNPLENAEISIFNRTLLTNASGDTSTNLIAGDYDYTVTLAPYGPVFGSATVVDADQTINITMEAAYDVTFTVTDGTNPIAGAEIAINDFVMGTTDGSGVLVVALSDGTYNYNIVAAGFADVTGSVTVAGAVLAEDVTMEPVYAVTFNVADEFANVMEGCTVTINGEDLTTDASGVVVLDLVAGSYPYAVNMAGYTEVTGTVDVVDAAVAVDVEMMLIRYTITFNAEDNTTAPLAGVSINVEGTIVTTDGSGVALLDTINGTYNYTATLAGYAAVLGEVVVADGDVAETITFQEPAYAVTFTVTNDGTTPIEGANVAVGGLNGLTDASGVVAFDLPAGDHDYTVTFAGYDDYTGTVTVVDVPVTVPTITMVETQYNITFVVKDEWAAPVEGATVTIDAEDIVTNASGVATFSRVAGTYDYAIVAAGYDNNSGSVEVINANKTVNVQMIALRYTATFTVDNVLGTLLEGASIDIDGQTVATDATGVATVDLPNGSYDYTVTFAGYEDNMGSITIADADLAEAVEMIETITNPSGVNVAVNGYDATLNYDQAEDFFDDMESYDDYIITGIGDYNMIDGDGSTTYGFNGITFTNSGYVGSFIVFNPSNTTPAVTGADAYSGEKYLACFAATTPANNDWLILPQQNVVDGMTFSFMARTYVPDYGLERFNVAVSTTGMNEEDFTVISGGSYTEAPVDWTEFSYDLSAYAGQQAYIAIQCVSNDAFIFMVDDISLTMAKEKAFVDYSIYLDDMVTPVAENVTATSYEFAGLEAGTYTAGVQRIYETGSSDIVQVEFTVEDNYVVTFNVTDGTNPVEGATIAINNGTLTTDASGVATVNLIDGTYDYAVTASGFAPFMDQVVVSGADVNVNISLVGMGEVDAKFSIYPNPTKGVIYIQSQGTNNVTVINAIGNVVKTQQINGNDQIDLSDFAKGIYFIRLNSDNKVATQRIIVE